MLVPGHRTRATRSGDLIGWSQTKGTAVVRRLVGKTALRVIGWRVTGPAPAPDQTCIFVGAPHTSGWDATLMLFVAWRYNLRVRFLIKREVIDGPFGWFWRAVGGISVDRANPGRLVEELIERAKTDPGFQLVLTPEGTRKSVTYWKSGFYRLGIASGLPVVLVAPDGPTKTVSFGPTFHLTGDVAADMDRIREFFATQHGVDPSKRTEPRLRAEEDAQARAELLAGTSDSDE